ncbi:phosphoglycerate mutase family protein [Allomuricauda sp. d1]|uniref:SixA phosphatase family protein n=1 Tax=Allomuricauda sp. d1 TaxID=3136725 RepID=UPI0031CDE605
MQRIYPLNRSLTVNFSLILLTICSLVACKNDATVNEDNREPVVTTFYLIRHAEKDRENPENPDPELNQDGLTRAMQWANIFEPLALDAIYSTNYERTSMTAAPTSVKKDIDIKYYEPDMDIESFKKENEGLNVLVVGHSNTTPVIANQLLGFEKYSQMDDNDNSSLFIIRIINGNATDIRLSMD